MNTRTRKVLSKEDEERFKREVQEGEAGQKETEATYPVDRGFKGLDSQTKRMKKILNEQEHRTLTNEEESRMEQLEEIISKRLIPASVYYQRVSKDGDRRSMDKAVRTVLTGTGEMTAESQDFIREWQTLRRISNRPSDVEELRPD